MSLFDRVTLAEGGATTKARKAAQAYDKALANAEKRADKDPELRNWSSKGHGEIRRDLKSKAAKANYYNTTGEFNREKEYQNGGLHGNRTKAQRSGRATDNFRSSEKPHDKKAWVQSFGKRDMDNRAQDVAGEKETMRPGGSYFDPGASDHEKRYQAHLDRRGAKTKGSTAKEAPGKVATQEPESQRKGYKKPGYKMVFGKWQKVKA